MFAVLFIRYGQHPRVAEHMAASSKLTSCFVRLTLAFSGSHSKLYCALLPPGPADVLMPCNSGPSPPAMQAGEMHQLVLGALPDFLDGRVSSYHWPLAERTRPVRNASGSDNRFRKESRDRGIEGSSGGGLPAPNPDCCMLSADYSPLTGPESLLSCPRDCP